MGRLSFPAVAYHQSYILLWSIERCDHRIEWNSPPRMFWRSILLCPVRKKPQSDSLLHGNIWFIMIRGQTCKVVQSCFWFTLLLVFRCCDERYIATSWGYTQLSIARGTQTWWRWVLCCRTWEPKATPISSATLCATVMAATLFVFAWLYGIWIHTCLCVIPADSNDSASSDSAKYPAFVSFLVYLPPPIDRILCDRVWRPSWLRDAHHAAPGQSSFYDELGQLGRFATSLENACSKIVQIQGS